MTDSEILEKLNSGSAKEQETEHQQYTEEQAMMAWETLDDSTIDKAEEENLNADEKFEDAKDDEFNFFGREVEVPGDYAQLKNSSSLNLMISYLQRSQYLFDSCSTLLKTMCLHVSFTAYENFSKLTKNVLSS